MTSYQSWLLPEPNPAAPDAWRLMRTSECDEVYIHDSYESYFKRLADLFGSINNRDTGKDAEIFLVGLEFMLGDGDHEESTLLRKDTKAVDLLLNAKNNGARIRLLVTQGNICFGEQRIAAEGIEVLRDYQGHHHQKAAYIRIKQISYLFVGGMDVSLGFAEGGMHKPRVGLWFDAQAEIRGRAAELGKLTLEERWASVRGIPFLPSFPRQAGTEHTFCQFVRTYPPPPPPPQNPTVRPRNYNADFSYGDILKQAIGKTNVFIYLEDQYFAQSVVPPGLDKLLLDAAQRGVRLIVVAARANQIEPYPQSQRAPLLKKFLDAFPRQAERSDRLFLLQLKEDPPPLPYFVHTKTWIFDDQLAVVGSANYWDPSFDGGDTEFGVAVASTLSKDDFPGVPFAHALRVRMWNRLLKAAGATQIKQNKDATLLDELRVLANGLAPLIP